VRLSRVHRNLLWEMGQALRCFAGTPAFAKGLAVTWHNESKQVMIHSIFWSAISKKFADLSRTTSVQFPGLIYWLTLDPRERCRFDTVGKLTRDFRGASLCGAPRSNDLLVCLIGIGRSNERNDHVVSE